MASSLGKDDPENNPEYAHLSDSEFDKICLKMNATRYVYGLTSVLSLTYLRKKHSFLQTIFDYALLNADKYLGA